MRLNKRIQTIGLLTSSMALLCGCYSEDYTVIHTEVNDAESLYNISCAEMEYRDPFIYVDKDKEAYYCPVVVAGGIKVFKSRDLKMWRDLGAVYNVSGLYSDYSYWAADMYKWKDNIYCIATAVSSNGGADDFTSQKCNTIFKGEYGPEGCIWPLNREQVNLIPETVTQNIDGSLYVDETGTPWLVYCKEAATEITDKGYDAGVYAYKLNDALTATIGEQVRLFNGSSSQYACAVDVRDGKDVYIADAPMLWRDSASGNLICIWSHYAKQPGNDQNRWYSVGQAVSRSGKIEGPWEHVGIINNYDGGHGCLFEDLDGNMKLAYHLNPALSKNGKPHLVIKDISFKNGVLEKAASDPAVLVTGKEEELTLKQDLTDYHIPVNLVFCDSYSGNVNVSMDQSDLQNLCDEYNIDRKTSYPLLPAASYSVADAQLGAGKLTGDIVITIDKTVLEEDAQYLLPIKVNVTSDDELELIDNPIYLIVSAPGRFEFNKLDQTKFKILFCNSSRAYERSNNGQGDLYLGDTYNVRFLIDGVEDKGWYSNFQWWEPFVQSRAGVENGTDDYDYDFTEFHAFKGRRCAISIVIDMQESHDIAAIGLLNRRPNNAGITDTKSVEFYVSDDAEFKFTPAAGIDGYDFTEYGNPSQNNWTKIAADENLVKGSSVQWIAMSEDQLVNHSARGRFLKIRLLGTYDGSITLLSLSEIYVKELTKINY
ncbi:MAG: family 43 glycosylhydrolase [Bacteroidales bacterium]|nr:family 43 glycosylhydrolase [Bacteroidales bacterium]